MKYCYSRLVIKILQVKYFILHTCVNILFCLDFILNSFFRLFLYKFYNFAVQSHPHFFCCSLFCHPCTCTSFVECTLLGKWTLLSLPPSVMTLRSFHGSVDTVSLTAGRLQCTLHTLGLYNVTSTMYIVDISCSEILWTSKYYK